MKINYFNLLFVMTISCLSSFYLGPVGVILFAIPFGIIGGFLWPIFEEDDR
jgi:hypothetical protein